MGVKSAEMNKQDSKLDRVIASARQARSEREQGYRDKALKMYPWICGRCMREFSRANLQELTVHHRDHNHDYNPEDGSNWELLCVFCFVFVFLCFFVVVYSDNSSKQRCVCFFVLF